MSLLKKVDHITYACARGTIGRWAWFHIDVEGGTLVNRIDDVRPDDPGSSMKIWCVDYGEFGIALVEGMAGRGFYEQIEDAIEAGDAEPLIDFSKMPTDWRVPEPAPRP